MKMRLLGHFQTFFFFFFLKRFRANRKHKKQTSEQKQKRQHFYAHKKHLRGRKLLVCIFVLFVCFKSFHKKIKKLEIALIASFTLLLKSTPKIFLSAYSIVSLLDLNLCTNLKSIESIRSK